MKFIARLYSRFTLVISLVLLNPSSAQNLNWIPFKWEEETIEGRKFPKLAITVPVTIDYLPHQFKMQLDLGAENTMIYGKAIDSYLVKYQELNHKIDKSLHCYINNHKYPMFKNVDFKIGAFLAGKINIAYFKSYGDKIPIDSVFTSSEKDIGTVAPDIFQNKILIIDYPNQRICVIENLPDIFADASFQPFKIKNGRIKIPLNINGQQNDLMFDTGSSLFTLLTTESRAARISAPTIIDSIKTSTWGEHYYVYGRKTDVPIKFGNTLLKPTTVFFDKKNRFANFYKQENMWGITGNAYFLNNIVIVDYKNMRFGVK